MPFLKKYNGFKVKFALVKRLEKSKTNYRNFGNNFAESIGVQKGTLASELKKVENKLF